MLNKFFSLLAVLCLPTSLALQSGVLVASHASFFNTSFCKAQQCQVVSVKRLPSDVSRWTKDYTYSLKSGNTVTVSRNDDPRATALRGRIEFIELKYRGNGNEPVAVQLSSLALGQRVTAQQLAQCFAQAKASSQREAWLQGTSGNKGGICRLKDGWNKQLVLTITD